MRVWRAVTIALVVGSVAVATPAGAGRRDESGSLYIELLALVSDTLGDDAPMAVLRARDEGFTTEQVLDAAGEGTLAADGVITEDGAPATPEGPPQGVVAAAGEAKVEQAVSDTQSRLAETEGIKPPKRYREDNVFVFMVLLGLMAEGYTVEQIVVDGLLADGIRMEPFQAPRIVDPADEPSEPEGEPVEPAVVGLVRDLVTVVTGFDPLNPRFEPQFRVTYEGELIFSTTEAGEQVARVTAKGRLGSVRGSGECCLGKLTGKVVTPPEDCTGGETVPLNVAINGFAESGSGEVALSQTWAVSGPIQSSYDPDTDTRGGFCISARELAPSSFPLLGSVLGPLSGFVEEGETLESFSEEAGEMRLTIRKKI